MYLWLPVPERMRPALLVLLALQLIVKGRKRPKIICIFTLDCHYLITFERRWQTLKFALNPITLSDIVIVVVVVVAMSLFTLHV